MTEAANLRIAVAFLVVAAVAAAGTFLMSTWDYRAPANIIWLLVFPAAVGLTIGRTPAQKLLLFIALPVVSVTAGYLFAIAYWGDYN